MRVPCDVLFSEDTREPHFRPGARGLFLDKTTFMFRNHFFMACCTAFVVNLSAPVVRGQCFECVIDPGCFGGTYPVLCPTAMPDATVGEYYEESATFHLPPVVVDPGSGLTVDFLSMSVMTVEGLPAGMVFTPNVISGEYFPTQGDDYGCAVVCGTPLESGSFSVDLTVEVVAAALGVEETVFEFFSLPFTVHAPDLAGPENLVFETDTLAGCAPLHVSCTSLYDGPMVMHAWDFGNGNTSFEAHPSAIYGQPGTYLLSLTAEVVQLQMTSFNWSVVGNGWNQDIDDVFGDPDLYFVLSGPQGPFYTSPTAENSLSMSLENLSVVVLNEQTHQIDFYDRDVVTGDDWLGGWSFTPCGQATWPIQGENQGEMQLSHVVVESVTGVDIVTVLEMPDGFSLQEVANVPGMDLTPKPDRLPALSEGRCVHDRNGDDMLSVADVLGFLDAPLESELCLLQIVQEFNKLRLKP